jgi:hypothetical protein
MSKSDLHWPKAKPAPKAPPKPLVPPKPSAPRYRIDPIFPPQIRADEEPNEIDKLADAPPFPDIIEERPFGPWEERIMGAFTRDKE